MRQSNTISSGTTFTAYLTDPRLWDCFIVGWYTNGPAKGGSEFFCFFFNVLLIYSSHQVKRCWFQICECKMLLPF